MQLTGSKLHHRRTKTPYRQSLPCSGSPWTAGGSTARTTRHGPWRGAWTPATVDGRSTVFAAVLPPKPKPKPIKTGCTLTGPPPRSRTSSAAEAQRGYRLTSRLRLLLLLRRQMPRAVWTVPKPVPGFCWKPRPRGARREVSCLPIAGSAKLVAPGRTGRTRVPWVLNVRG